MDTMQVFKNDKRSRSQLFLVSLSLSSTHFACKCKHDQFTPDLFWRTFVAIYFSCGALLEILSQKLPHCDAFHACVFQTTDDKFILISANGCIYIHFPWLCLFSASRSGNFIDAWPLIGRSVHWQIFLSFCYYLLYLVLLIK